jgi:tRNA (cytidine/uridine-2'-O-)-methyltransferase
LRSVKNPERKDGFSRDRPVTQPMRTVSSDPTTADTAPGRSATRLRLALYEPDIPQNAGTLIRTAACLGFAVDLVEPAGFSLDDRHLRRAGLDYVDLAVLSRHVSWAAFDGWRRGEGRRLVLLTTAAEVSHLDFAFRDDDVIMVGRESAGVPAPVHAAADARLRVPMLPGRRSLNVAVTAAIVLGEAMRRTDGFPPVAG